MSYEKTLNLIYSNDLIMEELQKVFMEEADTNRPKIRGQDDTVLGQEYRAYEQAKEIINDTFTRIKSMRQNESRINGVKYK